MNSLTKRALCLCLSLILVFGLAACSAAGGKKAERLSLDARPDAPSEIPEGLDIDWNARYTFAELEAQLARMAEQYPDISQASIPSAPPGRSAISGAWRSPTRRSRPRRKQGSASSPTSTAASAKAPPPPCTLPGG